MKIYTGYQHKFSDSFLINAGLYSQHYSLSKETTLEPLLSAQWLLSNGQSLTAGFGLHSQVQTRIIYYFKRYDNQTNTYIEKILDLKSTKTRHFIVGYEKRLSNDFKFKAETYYQNLYHVPVSKV